mgnify:CR=1 FL=1
MKGRLNLVTGGFGFTGIHVARALIDRGERVLLTDLSASLDDPDRRRLAETLGLDLGHAHLECIPSNLLEISSLQALAAKPITRVFHTASLYDYSAPLEVLMRVNVEGTRNLLAALESLPLERFVHWSTCGVFGKPYTARDGAKVNLPFNEASSSPKHARPDDEGPDGTHLVNAYSVSKWVQEKLVWRAHREEGLPLTVVRPAPIYGPGSSYGHGGLMLAIAQGWLPGIPSDAKNYITASVHVEDVAEFAVYSADDPAALGEDYNIVDNSIISFDEFLRFIALLTGRRLRSVPLLRLRQMRPLFIAAAQAWTFLERRFKVPRPRVFEIQSSTYVSSSYWLSNRKSLATGYAYLYPDVREGLKDTVAWFRQQGWLNARERLFTS